MSESPDCAAAVAWTLKRENFYSDTPGDPGGETVWGIARKMHPELPLWKLVDSFKGKPAFPENMRGNVGVDSLVREFYAAIWKRMACEECQSGELARVLFDSAVNPGEFAAVKMLQRALNFYCWNGKRWAPIIIDGGMGKLTVATLIAAGKYHDELADVISGLRMHYYVDKTEQYPDKRVNSRGYALRTMGKEG